MTIKYPIHYQCFTYLDWNKSFYLKPSTMDLLPSNFAADLVAGNGFDIRGKDRSVRFYYHQTLDSIQGESGWQRYIIHYTSIEPSEYTFKVCVRRRDHYTNPLEGWEFAGPMRDVID